MISYCNQCKLFAAEINKTETNESTRNDNVMTRMEENDNKHVYELMNTKYKKEHASWQTQLDAKHQQQITDETHKWKWEKPILRDITCITNRDKVMRKWRNI